MSVGGERLEKPEYKDEQAWTARKTVERTRIGYSLVSWALRIPERRYQRAGPEAPNVPAQGADDVDMGDEVA